MIQEKKRILLVDDDEIDALTFQRCIDRLLGECSFKWINDSSEVMKKLGRISETKLPHLIVLDINMPVVSGFDLLKKIKADKRLKHIPVVFLTTSQNEFEREKALKLQADAYLIKPIGVQAWMKELKKLKRLLVSHKRPHTSDMALLGKEK